MPCCTGGHVTVPYEQYTQQSPGSGWTIAWQAAHSWNHRHALVGMVSRVDTPHSGQVSTDSCSKGDIGKPRCAEKSAPARRSEEHTSALQSLMRTSYSGVCMHKKQNNNTEIVI